MRRRRWTSGLLHLALSLLLAWPVFGQSSDPFQSAPGPAPAAPAPAPPQRAKPQTTAAPRPVRPRPAPEPQYRPAVVAPTPMPAPVPRPPATPQAPARDGNWEVRGSPISMQCGTWSVRIGVAQGRLSGSYFVGDAGDNDGSHPITDLTWQPDGSFSGRAVTRSQGLFAVSGRFSGDTISIVLKSVSARCPETRTGQSNRIPM
jgi:hypothetical protein